MRSGIRGAVALSVALGGRRRLAVAFAGSAATAVLELLGVGLVLPLIIAVTDPSAADALPTAVRGLVPKAYDPADSAVLAALVVAVFVGRAVLTLLFRWWLHGFVTMGEAQLASRLMDGYLRAPIAFHRSRNSADLIRVLQLSVEHVYTRVVMSILTIATEGAVILLLVGALVLLEPVVALSALGYFAVAGILFARVTSGRARRIGRRYQHDHAAAMQAAQEAFGGHIETVVRGTIEMSVGRFRAIKEGAARTKQRFHFLNELPRAFLESAFLVGIAVLVVVVVATNDSRSGATASLALVAAVGFRVMPSLVKVAGALTSARAGMPALDLVLEDVNALGIALGTPIRRPAERGPSAWDHPRTIRFEGVSFVHEGDGADPVPVLTDVSFEVAPGEWRGIVGGSGAGKTTLLLLLLGLVEPTTGAISLDGVDLGSDVAAWRRTIGYVPQDLYLIDASLAENIRFGLPPAEDDEERLLECVRAAALEDVVATLPHGLETSISESGVRLSGGQRQRIGLARALYGRPAVLILDEATSSLDVDTERSVLQTLEALRGSHTIISVAHRGSAVRSCDQLVVLDAGRVVANGTFDALVRESLYFRGMVEQEPELA